MTKNGEGTTKVGRRPINAALVILHNDEHEYLLQHRTEDAERLPGYWAFFGGSIEGAETAEDAVKREALEELGYQLKFPRFVLHKDVVLESVECHLNVFVERYDGVTPIILGEGQGYGWFNVEESRRLKMIEHDLKTLEYVDQYVKGPGRAD
ncbi:MAG: NUDIX domain-containing protein [Nitrospinae bacterium]|nr:NUDIX domain-containing protein [Nitrospinota bacterium]